MPTINTYGTTENNPNYLGTLLEIGQGQTPLLQLLGGLGNAMPTGGRNYAMSKYYDTGAPSQPTISEDTALAPSNITTITDEQAENSTQIFQELAQVTYGNESDSNTLAGVPLLGGGTTRVSAIDDQIAKKMRKMAKDLNFTCWNGVYQKWDQDSVASGTRGISNALATNVVDGAAAALDKAIFNSLTKIMADNGSLEQGGSSIIGVNSSQLQALNDIYGIAERSFEIGGTTLDTINTSFARLPIMYDPNIAQDEIIIFDSSFVNLRVMPTKGQPLLVEELARTGAGEQYQLYGQFGIDYGQESLHGKLTNLATA